MQIDESDGKSTIDATDFAPLIELAADDLRPQMRNGEVRILSESGGKAKMWAGTASLFGLSVGVCA